MADMMYGATAAGGDMSEDNSADFYGGINNNLGRPRNPGLYVGNLTWWTTDQDVINAINSVGVKDVHEVKFFENRNNGQSKGFCVVTFGSDASLPIVMEKLSKLELYGQNPVVTPYNRQNLNLFEAQTKPRPQVNPANGPNPHGAGIMGISSISGVHANTQGLPFSGINSYNQAPGISGPRAPQFHHQMRMPMRAPRANMRGPMPNSMDNGGMMHQMPMRPRFIQAHQPWNNSQGSFNSGPRMTQSVMDVSSRLGMGVKSEESGVSQDMGGLQSYYTPHHPNPQSDHYRSDMRDHRDLRDDRDRDRDRDRERERDRDRDRDLDRERESARRLDDRPLRHDDRSLRHDERSLRHDDRPREERFIKHEERSSSRRDDRSSRRESSSRHDEGSSRREEKSVRREEKSSRREKSHRSRSRSKDKKDRRERRERH